jgi:hypothetical protein
MFVLTVGVLTLFSSAASKATTIGPNIPCCYFNDVNCVPGRAGSGGLQIRDQKIGDPVTIKCVDHNLGACTQSCTSVVTNGN